MPVYVGEGSRCREALWADDSMMDVACYSREEGGGTRKEGREKREKGDGGKGVAYILQLPTSGGYMAVCCCRFSHNS